MDVEYPVGDHLWPSHGSSGTEVSFVQQPFIAKSNSDVLSAVVFDDCLYIIGFRGSRSLPPIHVLFRLLRVLLSANIHSLIVYLRT